VYSTDSEAQKTPSEDTMINMVINNDSAQLLFTHHRTQ